MFYIKWSLHTLIIEQNRTKMRYVFSYHLSCVNKLMNITIINKSVIERALHEKSPLKISLKKSTFQSHFKKCIFDIFKMSYFHFWTRDLKVIF